VHTLSVPSCITASNAADAISIAGRLSRFASFFSTTQRIH
jgi:hypothetical protein